MQKLTFVIGATATGKTYFIENHFSEEKLAILNIYDYQQKAYEEAGFGKFIPFSVEFRCLMKANNMHLDDIIEELKQGQDVVAEQTFFFTAMKKTISSASMLHLPKCIMIR